MSLFKQNIFQLGISLRSPMGCWHYAKFCMQNGSTFRQQKKSALHRKRKKKE